MKKYYLVATKLNNRSFITADSPTEDFEKAKLLAAQYKNSSLWQGAEIAILADNIEIERIPV